MYTPWIIDFLGPKKTLPGTEIRTHNPCVGFVCLFVLGFCFVFVFFFQNPCVLNGFFIFCILWCFALFWTCWLRRDCLSQDYLKFLEIERTPLQVCLSCGNQPIQSPHPTTFIIGLLHSRSILSILMTPGPGTWPLWTAPVPPTLLKLFHLATSRLLALSIPSRGNHNESSCPCFPPSPPSS